MSRPVTIHSDGTGRGTVVLDEDGKQISGISNLSLNVDAKGVVEVTIEVIKSQVNIQGTVTEVIFECPLCSEGHTHTCDPDLGGIATTTCNSKLIRRDPYTETGCIRGAHHPDRHFDGITAWS
jgi:hypothetical protein